MRPDHTALKLGNIYWLLAAMAFVIAPHATRLPVWFTALCALVAAWRGFIAWRGLKAPRGWMMALLTAGATAATFVAEGRLYGRDASTMLLIVMLCLKLLEMRSRRDALLAIFLGFFLVFTNFLYSQTVMMGAYMLVCVWIFVATLIGFNRVGSEPTLRERLVPAALLIGQAIPMMLVIFFLFPRISAPLWRLPSDAHSGMSGLSDSMSPFDLSNLSLSEKVAFRADFKGPIPRNSELYWRGPVMWDFDGRTWYMQRFAPRIGIGEAGITALGNAIDYTVTLEPHGKYWLFALDVPDIVPADASLTLDLQLRSNQPTVSLKRYDMRSHLLYRAGANLGEQDRARALRLPRRSNPRAVEFAKKLRADYADDAQFIRQTLLLYNREFTYTLRPPTLGGNPIDEFLFDTKQGFCEHYSGSFVVLMRAAGIPARVVTGYQGGEVNTVGNYLIVRQADAHAWAEVWLEERGWVRIDPTAAVSPDRIESGIDLALGPVGVMGAIVAADQFGILRLIRFSWDSVNNQWNQWVIGYNTDRQRDFLSQLGIDNADWRNVAMWLLIGCFGVGGGVSLFVLAKMRASRPDPAVAAYQVFVSRLQKTGIERAPHEGPLDFLARVEAERPAVAHAARRITRLYVELRYAADENRIEKLRELRSLARAFKPV
jgi:transglutaminase-like putative cysteine protease